MNGYIRDLYVANAKKIQSPEGNWDTLEVTISKIVNGEKEPIGKYNRNYPSLAETFFPFVRNGKHLALYSRNYSCTRIMELPSCEDIGGEEITEDGFCPAEFYVPVFREFKFTSANTGELITDYATQKDCLELKGDSLELGPITYCDFGFVSGCVWGDDTSWKVEYLDLSEADKGVLKRIDKFDYLELPHGINLKDAIYMLNWSPEHQAIEIATRKRFVL